MIIILKCSIVVVQRGGPVELEGTIPKQVRDSAHQERLGVAAVQQAVSKEFNWLFREQSTSDYGIDAHIEVVNQGIATGHLIAAQIKSGQSYFSERTEAGWWFRLEAGDLEYWLDHSLPVIVILHDGTRDKMYWEKVTTNTVVTGPKGGKKILIPERQSFDAESRESLKIVSDGKPFEIRMRQLQLVLPWMRLLEDGTRLLLEADEWINKTSGRGEVRLFRVDDVTNEKVELASWAIMAGLRPYASLLPKLVPWASLDLEPEIYYDADHELWESECVYLDSEGDEIVSLLYDDWRATRFRDGALRPFGNGAGEVDFWCLELSLNKLGRGFLEVSRFADGKGQTLTPNAPG